MPIRKTKKKSKGLDKAEVKRAAEGRWPEILECIAGIPAGCLTGKHGPCPKCGGKDRFRFIDEEKGAVLCNACFSCRNGDGLAAIQWMKNRPPTNFKKTVYEVAEYLGLNIGDARRPIDADEQLAFRKWDDIFTLRWCEAKQPVKPESIQKIGGQQAIYMSRYRVFAIPIWGTHLDEAGPVGWIVMSCNPSHGLPKRGQDGKIEFITKPKLTAGSSPGLIGDMKTLRSEATTTVWKLEGITDLLAWYSMPDRPEGHVAVTNSNGCMQRPSKWMVDAIQGDTSTRSIYVIHDADLPGQRGATGWTEHGQHRNGWAEELATKERPAVNVVLPFVVHDTNGQDFRDWCMDYGTFTDLRAMAEVSPEILISRIVANELPDDPFRLARLNLDQYEAKTGGRTIKYWMDSWWVWKRQRYVEIGRHELRAKLTMSIKEEFDRLNMQEMEAYEKRRAAGEADDETSPTARKISVQTVLNVEAATRGLTYLPGSCALGTWIPTRERRPYVSLRNGILDVDKALRSEVGYLLEHSPDWFSTSHLDFDFKPEATCTTWLEFLEYNLDADWQMIRFLQEWVGYLLLPDTREQSFLILHGEGGNGKTVFCAGVEALLGTDNCSSVPLESFGDRFSKTGTLGRLVNICGDVGELDAVAEGTIKAFTGGNKVSFDRKGIPAVEAHPTARLMIACNNLPRIRDRSEGIWRRMLISPWEKSVPPDKRVKGMDSPDWWIRTGELSGMFNWALVGLHRLREKGAFSEVATMSEARREYQDTSNSARLFLREHTDKTSGVNLKCSHLFRTYAAWCKENGFSSFSSVNFYREVHRYHTGIDTRRIGPRGQQQKFYVDLDYISLDTSDEELAGAYTSNF